METSFGKFEIFDQAHSKRFLEEMNNFRKTRRFCDVKLLIGDKVLYGHRTVLALCSPWFNKQLELKVEDTITIDNEKIYDIMSIIIDYMYTGFIKFCLEDAIDIWKTLEHLQMKSVLRIFENYLIDNIKDDNCIELFVLSEELDHKDLKQATVAYIVKNLKTFIDSKMFKHLSKPQLETILTAAIDCNSAEAMCEAVTTWLKYEDDRNYAIEDLLKFVKVIELSGKFIRKTILTENYFKLYAPGRQWLVDSFLCDTSPIVRNDQVLYIFPRVADNWSFEFDINENFLTKQQPRPTLNFCAMVKNKGTIYALGGATETERLNVGYKYETAKKKWIEFSCSVGKKCCGICTGDDKIYLIGGLNPFDPQKTCSTFDIGTEQLLSIPYMEHTRYLPGVSYYNSSVYVFGGYDGSVSTVNNRAVFGIIQQKETIVERYDTREGKWSTAGKCQLQMSCSSAPISNFIFCLECDSGKIVKYDPRVVAGVAVSNHPGQSMASLNDYLYLAHKDGIARYDPYSDAWIEVQREPLQLPLLVG